MTALRVLLGLALALPTASRAEQCRFEGTTTAGGHITVRTEVTQADGATTVDVAVTFRISAWMSDVRYYGQEISLWHGTTLQQIAVNQRTLIDDTVKRQQWDVFHRVGGTLQAYRVQAKRLAEFRQHHPGFVRHWPVAAFAQPWLADYDSAPAERRPDLDLPAANARSPFAEAFYWSRYLPPVGSSATVVLPGFKRDLQSELNFSAPIAGDGWNRWSTPLHHPALDRRPVSLAAVWVSPQHYLLQLGVEMHNSLASGQATIRATGCQGVQLRPEE